MTRYIDYIVKNTNDDRFMVCCRECGTDRLRSLHASFADAYQTARACLFGQEPTDETKHH